MSRSILHLDLDAFFASVEQLDNPAYRGKPVIVGGQPGDRRSVVSTCSYEARKYGVHSAMPVVKAYKLCPNGIYLPGRMHRYHELSSQVMEIFRRFSPDVQQMSVDEAFVDLTGTEKLFGPPEETALKIKQTVKEETGLTVSAGLASNHYVAKIASGVSKPDGFFYVKPGEEEDFMLSLNLEKLWGAGGKTQEKLKASGFYTIKSIHNATLTSLCALFGQHTGNFLYQAVRGREVENFSDEAKSHSISAERTFSFDLTDSFVIETELLRLCFDVMFRLLRENWNGRTVQLKIRYEDFSTVSISETGTRSVSSVDDLFERTCRLFHKKYENGRGIRLFGVGVQNLEAGTEPSQAELFDFGEKKKKAVEKAVLEISRKNPSSKVQKARQLISSKHLIFLFCMFTGFFSVRSVHSMPFILEETAPKALFTDINKSEDVEFYARGHWESSVESSLGFNFTPSSGVNGGTVGSVQFTPFVFTQNVDISVWFFLLNKYYFEASFADGFTQNTVAAGYYGDGFLKHFRIGNSKIDFPLTYSVPGSSFGIGGGSKNSPGMLLSFAGEKWKADAVFRFDMLKSCSKTWYGMNEKSENLIEASDYLRGRFFVLPEGTVSSITNVCVEDSSGSHKDNAGKKYRQLLPSEYLIIPSINTLCLLKSYAGNILIETDDSAGLKAALPGFFAETAEWFSSAEAFAAEKPDLSEFTGVADSYDGLFTVLKSVGSADSPAFYLKRRGLFSVFENCSFYECSSTEQSMSVSVVSKTTGTKSDAYGSEIVPGYTDSLEFFAKVYPLNADNPALSPLSAAQRFPFADKNPYVYLVPSGANESSANFNDILLSYYTVSSVSELNIGTDAVEGTVFVYRNNILENCTYDSKSGTVTLFTTPSDTDEIRIVWSEYNSDSPDPAFTGALGFEYKISDYSDVKLSLTSRFPTPVSKAYSETDSVSQAFAALSAGYSYKKDNLEFSDSLSGAFVVHDTTGLYKILGFNGSSSAPLYFLSSALETDDAAGTIDTGISGIDVPGADTLLYDRNYRNYTVLNAADQSEIQAKVSRSSIADGYQVDIGFDLSGGQWASQLIKLPSSAALLNSASSLSLKMKGSCAFNDADIYLLIRSESDFSPCWLISKASLAAENPEDVSDAFITDGDYAEKWQTVKVCLKKEDISRIINAEYLQIIAVSKAQSTVSGVNATLAVSGCSNALSETGFKTEKSSALSSVNVLLEETLPPAQKTAEMQLFDDADTSYVQHISFDTEDFSKTDGKITVSKFVSEIPLANYAETGFYVFVPEQSTASSVRFILKNESTGETAVDKLFSADEVKQWKGSWHKVTVPVPSYAAGFNPNKIELVFSSPEEDTVNRCDYYIDSFFASGSEKAFIARNNAYFAYERKDSLLKIGNYSVIENFNVKMNSDISYSADSNAGISVFKTTVSSGADIPLVSVSGNITHAADDSGFENSASMLQDKAFSSVEYRIKTRSTTTLGKIFSLEDEYKNINDSEKLFQKNQLQINLSPVSVPVSILTSLEAGSSDSVISQKGVSELVIDKFLWLPVKSTTTFSLNQTLSSDSYSIREIQFSNGFSEAKKRVVSAKNTETLALKNSSFAPSLSFEAESLYTNTGFRQNTESFITTATIPFKVGKNSFSVAWQRKTSADSFNQLTSSYAEDFSLFNDKPDLFLQSLKSIPVYDYFDDSIDDSLKNLSDEGLYTYMTLYQGMWKRQISNSLADLFLPASFTVDFLRDVSASGLDASESYTIKSQLNFTAFNLFGKKGLKPLFSFYDQDEIIQSFSMLYKNDELTLNFNNATSLYVKPAGSKNSGTVRFTTQLSDTAGKTRLFKEEVTWKRPGKTSLVNAMLAFFAPDLTANKNKIITRTETFSFSGAKTVASDKEKLSLTALYNHSAETTVNESTKITAGFNSSCAKNGSTFSLNFGVSLSLKLSF